MKLSERMHEKMTRLRNLSNADLLERAWQELSALCGSDGPPKKWRMSIPVDADGDSDVLFGEVLTRFAQLEDRNKRMVEGLRNEGKRIVKALEDYAKDLDKLSVASNDSPEK